MTVSDLNYGRRQELAKAVEVAAQGTISNLIKTLAGDRLYHESGELVDIHTQLVALAKKIGGEP